MLQAPSWSTSQVKSLTKLSNQDSDQLLAYQPCNLFNYFWTKFDEDCQGRWFGGMLVSFHQPEVDLVEPMWMESFMWLEVKIHFKQSLTLPPVAFIELSGLDENYDYLKEILLWDPLSETWQVLCQSRLAMILYISSNQIWNWQNVCHFATISWLLNIIPNQRPMRKSANLQHIAHAQEVSQWGEGKSERCSREWF